MLKIGNLVQPKYRSKYDENGNIFEVERVDNE